MQRFATLRLQFLLASVIAGLSASDTNAQNWPIRQDGNRGIQRVTKPRAVGIPGEYEKQAALVISWRSDEVAIMGTLLEIAQLATRKAPVIVLVNSPKEQQDAEMAFGAARIDPSRLKFLQAPVNTIWARDFGPVVVRNRDGSVHFLDSDYDDGDRPEDDNIPPVLASQMNAKCVRSLLTIEGGNLLSNGAGLCLTSSKTVADNVIRGYEHGQFSPLFRTTFQCESVVLLEPLMGEPTGHVDMFSTFTSANTVVVGEIDPLADPVNAAILDRNAARLSRQMTTDGPLRVQRIPMPVPKDGLWRSFTNVLYFNGILMMPVYDGVETEMEQDALDVYRKLLPGWSAVGIDCTKLIRFGGAIHCVTLNLPTAKREPAVPLQPSLIQHQQRPEFTQQTAPERLAPQPRQSLPIRQRRLPAFPRPAPRYSSSPGPSNRVFAHPDKSSFLPD